MDVYLAEQIDGGLECHFSPLEATYGIFSIGSLAALVATVKYVPGLSPAVSTLLGAARALPSVIRESLTLLTTGPHICRSWRL